MFLQLVVSSLATLPLCWSAFDCKLQTSCESCYDSSFLCHWCKDLPPDDSTTGGSCHAKMSTFGCQVGDACSSDDCAERTTCSACNMGGCKWCASQHKCVSPYSWACAMPSNCIPNEECKRQAPEFVGFRNDIPKWVVYTMVIGYTAACVFIAMGLYLCYPSAVGRRFNEEDEQVLVVESSPPQKRKRILFKLFAGSCLAALLALGVGLTLTGFYWPSLPHVSMCNAELMWKNTIDMIIKTISTGKTNVESELLITVYNPNRFGGTVNSISGNVYYKTNSVGSFDLGYVDVAPGSASDGLGVLTFNGFENISEMYYDFNVKHSLLLEFELFTSFSIGGHDISTTIPRFPMNVSKPPPQEYCKCKEGSSVDSTDDTFDNSFYELEVM